LGLAEAAGFAVLVGAAPEPGDLIGVLGDGLLELMGVTAGVPDFAGAGPAFGAPDFAGAAAAAGVPDFAGVGPGDVGGSSTAGTSGSSAGEDVAVAFVCVGYCVIGLVSLVVCRIQVTAVPLAIWA
jgi:hypothetical protein